MVGATLGQKYKLVRLLGEGGMGAVYEAEQVATLERVAVKVIHGHLLKPGSDGPRRFRREAQAASAVNSDYIIQVFDSGVDGDTGLLYLVMEYLEGEDLQHLSERVGPLAPDGALRIAAQVLVGLQKAHEAHIVHRDLKPANLFLARRRDGAITIKLLDFGIAKITADPLGLPQTTDLTTTGRVLGSPLYMSPEQVQSGRVDHRTDIWSLGSTLYCALAGRAPHQHIASVGQLLVAICISRPPPLRQVAPWLPPEIAAVVDGALELRPEARYASAAAMLEAIRRLLPSGHDLREEMLTPVGEGTLTASSRAILPGSSPTGQRIVVGRGATQPIRGDETTARPEIEGTSDEQSRSTTRSDDPPPIRTKPASSVHRESSNPIRPLARPAGVGEKAEGPRITVDPSKFLGSVSEPWIFPFDAQELLVSFLASVYHALRDAGAKIPPMTYGQTWILFDPHAQRAINKGTTNEEHKALRLGDAGIEPGRELWVMSPESIRRRGME